MIPLTHGEPIRFGPAGDDGLGTYAVVREGFGLAWRRRTRSTPGRSWSTTPTDHELAFALSRLSDQDLTHTVTGVFRNVDRTTYDDAVRAQVQQARDSAQAGRGRPAGAAERPRHLDRRRLTHPVGQPARLSSARPCTRESAEIGERMQDSGQCPRSCVRSPERADSRVPAARMCRLAELPALGGADDLLGHASRCIRPAALGMFGAMALIGAAAAQTVPPTLDGGDPAGLLPGAPVRRGLSATDGQLHPDAQRGGGQRPGALTTTMRLTVLF